MTLSNPGSREDDGHGHRGDCAGEAARVTESDAVNRVWRFLAALQSVRDLRTLPEILSLQLASFVCHDGLRYRSPDLEVDAMVGRSARHRCGFRLTHDGTRLGELDVYRSERFSEGEVRGLEALLSLTHQSVKSALECRPGGNRGGQDPLTGLADRSALTCTLQRAIAAARMDDGCVAVVFVDVDGFSAVNEQFGRRAGDLILRRVADRLSVELGPSERLFRHDGDRFVVVSRGAGAHRAGERAGAWLRCIETCPFDCDGRSVPVTLSAGVAIAGGYWDAPEMLSVARDALLGAKGTGGNRVQLAAPRVLCPRGPKRDHRE